MKYVRVRDELLERLSSCSPGDPLPPERELAAELGVSRVTLRRAVDELVLAGRVVRRSGAGAFVASPKMVQELTATSFSADMRTRGMRPGARTMSSEVIFAGAPLGRRLEVSPETRVLRVERIRLANDTPMAIETLVVPCDVVPGLTGQDLDGCSFYQLLAERFGVGLGSGVQVVEPTVTDAEESRLLEVPLHSPAFLFERTSRDEGGRVFEFVRSVYRGDRYQIVTELAPASAQGAPQSATGVVRARQ